jgi:hypothetical protein
MKRNRGDKTHEASPFRVDWGDEGTTDQASDDPFS